MKLLKTPLCILLCMLLCLDTFSQEVAQFRGTHRDGVYDGSNLLETWPESGPLLKWSTEEVGEGFSAPTVTKNAVYITGKIDSLEILTAFDKNGIQLWSTSLGKAWAGTFPESRCTPTVNKDHVYVVNSYGTVICIAVKDGKTVWSTEVSKDFSGVAGNWGIAESVLLVDNKVIFTPAGEKTTMVALDKNTGKLIWQTESLKDTTDYASSIVVEYGGKKVILNAAQNNAFAVDAENGKILCKYTFDRKKRPMNVNTPIYRDGQAFFPSGYDTYSHMLKLSKDLSKFELVWKDTLMDSEYGFVVYKDGYLYGSNWINARKGNWCCVDWKTGKLKYETTWQTKGTLSLAGKMLYCMDEKRGNIALVKADPEKFEVISSFQLPKGRGPCWSNPVIDDGTMYVRRGSALLAYNISK